MIDKILDWTARVVIGLLVLAFAAGSAAMILIFIYDFWPVVMGMFIFVGVACLTGWAINRADQRNLIGRRRTHALVIQSSHDENDIDAKSLRGH